MSVSASVLNQISIYHYVGLSLILFFIGALSVLVRRNTLVVLISIELMLNAVNLLFVTFSKHWNQLDGQIFVFFTMTIAAAEAAVGLALVVAIFKRFKEVNIRQFERLRH